MDIHFFILISMSFFPPAIPVTLFGSPIEFEGRLIPFSDPEFPLVRLVRYEATLWIDVGFPYPMVPIRLVSVFIDVGGNLVGPLRHPGIGGGGNNRANGRGRRD